MTRLPLVVGLACLLTAPAFAQGGDADVPVESTAPVDEVLEVVVVPEGMGDGLITTNDALALAEFSVWCYDRALQTYDPSLALGPDASARALLFWDAAWYALDPDTKALISVMDQVWPAVQSNWAESDEEQRLTIVTNVMGLIEAVWGDQMIETAGYFAGEVSEEDYLPAMQLILARYESAALAAESPEGDAPAEDGSQLDFNDAVSTYLGNFIEY